MQLRHPFGPVDNSGVGAGLAKRFRGIPVINDLGAGIDVDPTSRSQCSDAPGTRSPHSTSHSRSDGTGADPNLGAAGPGLGGTRSQRQDLLGGGIYPPQTAIALINEHYCIGTTENDVAIYRIADDGTLSFVKTDEFKLHVANMQVEVWLDNRRKIFAASKHWMESKLRNQKAIVFKPGGTNKPNEYNQWRGFGIVARKGFQRQRRLLRHIYEVICRSDKQKFKYLMRWLAWAVQNPDKPAGVVVVLMSRKQGTGKTTLGAVMLDIFGRHGALIDDKERLLGRFNDWLETISFVLC
jgi:hypothetical protein